MSEVSRSVSCMSSNSERSGPVTVQEVKDRLAWIVNTHVVSEAEREFEREWLPPVEFVPPLVGPPRDEREARRQVIQNMMPPPTAASVLARLGFFPVAIERGREYGYAEAVDRISSGDAEPTDDGSTWFAMDTAELRAHFDERTVDAVAECYERGWMRGWLDYCETQIEQG